jgi:O-methyltransferase involved in polyketide biosynthesis
VDTTRPNAARVYDYFLGGDHNFAADREFAEQVLTISPHVPAVTQLNRTFLRRAVRYLLDQGVDQFLDLGSGIPTVGNTHQIAEQAGVGVHVIYVDREPVAFYHAENMLQDTATAKIVQADMRNVDEVLGHEATGQLLDLSRPVGLLVVGVLLYLPDPEPAELIRAYCHRLAPGSFVAVSTLTGEHAGPELRVELDTMCASYAAAGEPVYPRDHAEILSWFDGLDLVEPGLVTLPEWHTSDPEELDDPARPLGYGALAAIPGSV